MAFFGKMGKLLMNSAVKQINHDLSMSTPSVFQAITSMSSAKLFVRGRAKRNRSRPGFGGGGGGYGGGSGGDGGGGNDGRADAFCLVLAFLMVHDLQMKYNVWGGGHGGNMAENNDQPDDFAETRR